MAGTIERRSIDLSNWREHPFSRFSFQNVSEFVPTAPIGRARDVETPARDATPFESVLLSPDGEPVTLLDHLRRGHTDSFVALRGGARIAEWHADHVDPERPHLVFSISKSVTGLLAGIAVGDGRLDPDAPISRYVPMPPSSAYATARVRDLLDMTVDVAFDEEYGDADGVFDRYRRAMLWNPQRSGQPSETLESFLGSLPAVGQGHGRSFYYASPNSDLLGLVVERAVGKRFHEFLRDRLWRPMGASGAANVTVDRAGTARAAGGISMIARDLALLGQLVLDGGRDRSGRQIVPADWMADTIANGDRRQWTEGNFADMFAQGRYRSGWYQTGDARGSVCAIGIHGQWLWIDPVGGTVLAKTSSRPAASDDADTAREIAALSQISVLLGQA